MCNVTRLSGEGRARGENIPKISKPRRRRREDGEKCYHIAEHVFLTKEITSDFFFFFFQNMSDYKLNAVINELSPFALKSSKNHWAGMDVP